MCVCEYNSAQRSAATSDSFYCVGLTPLRVLNMFYNLVSSSALLVNKLNLQLTCKINRFFTMLIRDWLLLPRSKL